jgi:hypothetical protein
MWPNQNVCFFFPTKHFYLPNFMRHQYLTHVKNLSHHYRIFLFLTLDIIFWKFCHFYFKISSVLLSSIYFHTYHPSLIIISNLDKSFTNSEKYTSYLNILLKYIFCFSIFEIGSIFIISYRLQVTLILLFIGSLIK